VSSREQWPTQTTGTTVISQERTVEAPVPAPPPVPPVEPDRSIGLGMLVALALVALAVAVAAVAWLLTHRTNSRPQTAGTSGAAAAQSVAVPQLVGLSEQAALIQLGHAGLTPKLVRRTSGPRDDLVVEQRPVSAATIARGSAVTIVVDPTRPAAGSKPVAGSKPKPTVPAPITKAPALPQSTVPDLSGKSEAAAVDTLDQAGLLPSIVFVPSQDPLGTVEAQSKSAGTSLPASARVQINLSQGPNMTVRETIPNVVGKTLTDAVSVLNASHLRLIYIKRPVQTRADVGTVIQQTPLSGGQAPQNTQVLVFLGVLATR
jgi:beta-lactam-binding protein with PASTA domain